MSPNEARSAYFLNGLQTIAILAGLIFGGVQIVQFRQEQHRQAEMELARSFITAEFSEALALVVLNMPDTVTSEVAQSSYAKDMGKIFLLAQTFETVGILVHNGDLKLELVDDLMGTNIIASWNKLRPWMVEYRTANNAPSVVEWFQWLAERLTEYRAHDTPPPAYKAFRDWKP